jgi:hypothetical protein
MPDETVQLAGRTSVRHDYSTAKKGSGVFFSFCRGTSLGFGPVLMASDLMLRVLKKTPDPFFY